MSALLKPAPRLGGVFGGPLISDAQRFGSTELLCMGKGTIAIPHTRCPLNLLGGVAPQAGKATVHPEGVDFPTANPE